MANVLGIAFQAKKEADARRITSYESCMSTKIFRYGVDFISTCIVASFDSNASIETRVQIRGALQRIRLQGWSTAAMKVLDGSFIPSPD